MNTSDPDITLFSQRETTQESALVGKVFLGVASAEALVILLVVAFLASWYWALIAAIAIFGILILTYYQMQVEPTKAPHSLTSQELIIRRGRGFHLALSLANIAKASTEVKSQVLRSGIRSQEDTLYVLVSSSKNLIEIHLKEPVFVQTKGFFQNIVFNADEPAKLISLLSSVSEKQPKRPNPISSTQHLESVKPKNLVVSNEYKKSSTNEKASIELVKVSKAYGPIKAVENLSLKVFPGQILGFLGANGAGKTTTMEMIAGLLKPSDGQIFINENLSDGPSGHLLGYMPEQPILYEQLTGIEFTRFIAALYTCTLSEENEERIQHYFEKFEMTPYANRQIRHYSQGMKRKISLIAVLSYDPPILMLDEPTNGLDPKGIRQINSLLRELADRSKTVFVSTHILPIAEKLCDRLAIIDKGQLIAEGSLAELRQKSQMTTDLEEIFLNLTNPENAETL